MREGDFEASRLDESVQTGEIREVNIGFNRMAQRLAKIDQDRAIMLAGISHDLRTPLARLRLAVAWMQLYRKWQRGEMAGDRYAGFETLALAILAQALTAFSKDAT